MHPAPTSRTHRCLLSASSGPRAVRRFCFLSPSPQLARERVGTPGDGLAKRLKCALCHPSPSPAPPGEQLQTQWFPAPAGSVPRAAWARHGTAREPAGGSPQLSQGLPRAWRPAARAAACLRLETARVSARAEFQPGENRVLLHACTGRFYVTWAGKQIAISQVFIYRGSCIRSDHNLCFSVT